MWEFEDERTYWVRTWKIGEAIGLALIRARALGQCPRSNQDDYDDDDDI